MPSTGVDAEPAAPARGRAAVFEGVLPLMVHGSRQLLVLGSGLKVQEYGQEV